LSYVIAAIYKFVTLENHEQLREPLLELMRAQSVRGTLLLASEGINGTIAGPREGIDRVLAHIESNPQLTGLSLKESFSETQPFNRTKVRLKKEIVTLGVKGVDPNKVVGTYVEPKDWNALISDPDVTVIDTRNQYEVELGTFQRAVDPQTESFREFPAFVDKAMDTNRHKRVAMFCTGGIRCEKSTAYLKGLGFDEVYHLRGGILKYLEEVPESESLWRGECFVFDGRVTVTHDLQPGDYSLCYACRHPISEADKQAETFEKGVSCPRCYGKITDEQRERFRNRQKQVDLAAKRGEVHIGEENNEDGEAEQGASVVEGADLT
tara:strand:+ start:150 stop:1118 length:969 start_codon:yes stop_codon:yes gene_type:complete